jgi:hypothetical protein
VGTEVQKEGSLLAQKDTTTLSPPLGLSLGPLPWLAAHFLGRLFFRQELDREGAGAGVFLVLVGARR